MKFKLLIFFCSLAVVLYGVTLWGDFVFDDINIIQHYEVLKNPFELKQIFSLPYWSYEAGLYRPVTLLTYSFNFLLLDTASFGFHFVNVLMYGFICFLIYKLLFKLFGDKRRAFLAGLIFLLLPIHSEVVANIIGRAEILALLFSLLLLLEFIKEKISPWKLGLFLFLAIASKETAIAIFPIALIVLYLKEKNGNPTISSLFHKYGYPVFSLILGASIYFILRLLVLGPDYFLGIQTSIVENPLIHLDWLSRFSTALSVFSMYVQKSFLPFGLCSDYSFNQIQILSNIFHPEALIGLMILVVASLSIFVFIKRVPEISLGAGFLVFAFLPVSNLFFPIGTIAGERLMFFPSVGLAIIFSYVCIKIYEYLTQRGEIYRKIGIGLFGLLMLFYACMSISRSMSWLSEKRLFTSAASCSPNSVLSLSNMGTVYYFQGRFEEAKEILIKSENIYDGYSKGLNNLGLVYFKMGEIEKAKSQYHKALLADFPYSGAIENLVLLYLKEEDMGSARRWMNVFYPNQSESIDIYLKNYKK